MSSYPHWLGLCPSHHRANTQTLLQFIWRGMQLEQEPSVYEWQVLPFGTTCSPCCATYAVHKHVQDHCDGNGEVLQSVQYCFYVDNCLQSFPSSHEAKPLIDKMRPLLADSGFNIRQWASNDPTVIHHQMQSPKPVNCGSQEIETPKS